MNIQVTYGVGEGLTPLAAFDAALHNAGIANYNIIRLSSIIPPRCTVSIDVADRNNIEIGYKLFVIMASATVTKRGESAFAGLGWMHSEEYGGVFVQHSGRNEDDVIQQIRDTFESMREYRNVEGNIQHKVVGIECRGKPVCALAAAIYESEPWSANIVC